jgi:hypothetical protein
MGVPMFGCDGFGPAALIGYVPYGPHPSPVQAEM